MGVEGGGVVWSTLWASRVVIFSVCRWYDEKVWHQCERAREFSARQMVRWAGLLSGWTLSWTFVPTDGTMKWFVTRVNALVNCRSEHACEILKLTKLTTTPPTNFVFGEGSRKNAPPPPTRFAGGHRSLERWVEWVGWGGVNFTHPKLENDSVHKSNSIQCIVTPTSNRNFGRSEVSTKKFEK